MEGLEQQALDLQRDRLATLGTLSAGLAHEINNPLSYVLANLRFLSREIIDLKRQLDEGAKPLKNTESLLLECAQVLSESIEGVQQIGKLVKDMKRFARSDESQGEWFELQEILESSLRIIGHELKHRVSIEKQFERVLPCLWGSPARIQQVFINLLMNAAQAIDLPPGELGRVEIGLSRKAGGILAVVKDNGTGIPPEHMGKLFDPFFTTKAFENGTGLGLFICKELIVQHGGYLHLESTPGEGTQAHVWLPVKDKTD